MSQKDALQSKTSGIIEETATASFISQFPGKSQAQMKEFFKVFNMGSKKDDSDDEDDDVLGDSLASKSQVNSIDYIKKVCFCLQFSLFKKKKKEKRKKKKRKKEKEKEKEKEKKWKMKKKEKK